MQTLNIKNIIACHQHLLHYAFVYGVILLAIWFIVAQCGGSFAAVFFIKL